MDAGEGTRGKGVWAALDVAGEGETMRAIVEGPRGWWQGRFLTCVVLPTRPPTNVIQAGGHPLRPPAAGFRPFALAGGR